MLDGQPLSINLTRSILNEHILHTVERQACQDLPMPMASCEISSTWFVALTHYGTSLNTSLLVEILYVFWVQIEP